MNKIICQNCYKILGEKNSETVRLDSNETNLPILENENGIILTLRCPKCDCILQVKTRCYAFSENYKMR